MTPLWELRLRVRNWIVRAFGEAILLNRAERAARVLEEAAELAQAEGVTPEWARRIVERCYSRPKGVAAQELAQLMVVVLGHSAAAGIDVEAVTIAEIERIEQPAVIARIRLKQAEKAADGTGVGLTTEASHG